MRVLVAGASGYIGSHLATRLLREGHAVRCLVPRADYGRMRRYIELGAEVVMGNVAEPATLVGCAAGMETVVNLLGTRSRLESQVRQVYVDGALALLAEAQVAGVRHWIQMSNVGVYGDQQEAWVDEHAVPRPNYSAGKIALLAETAVRAVGERMAMAVLRLPAVIGAELPGVKPHIPAPLYAGEGENWLNYVHVSDLCSALVRLAELRYDGVLHLSDGVPCRAREAAALIAAARGGSARAIPLEQVRAIYPETTAGILTNSVRLCSDRAVALLSLGPRTTLADTLAACSTSTDRKEGIFT